MCNYKTLFKIFYLVFFLATGNLLIGSCKKDDPASNTNHNQENREFMLSGVEKRSWKVSKITARGINITSQVPECYKNNIWTFFSNKRFEMDEGESKCQDYEPQTAVGTWYFNSDKTILTIDINSAPETMTILSISESFMRVSGMVTGQKAEMSFTAL